MSRLILLDSDCLDLNPNSATYWLCDLELVT